MQFENSFVVILIILFGAIVIPLERKNGKNLDVFVSDYKCAAITSSAFNKFHTVSVKIFGAPSLTVLCFYGFCHDGMPYPVRSILEKLNRAEYPLSENHVSTKAIQMLQCTININPQAKLFHEDDNLLTAILISFLDELRESVLTPATATEMVVNADNLTSVISRITLLPRANRVVLIAILELGYTLTQRRIMNADKFAQLFGPHLYRPFQRIQLSESEYQDTLTMLNPCLINLIEKYDVKKMAKLSENFEACSEFLDREYLYTIFPDGTCRA